MIITIWLKYYTIFLGNYGSRHLQVSPNLFKNPVTLSSALLTGGITGVSGSSSKRLLKHCKLNLRALRISAMTSRCRASRHRSISMSLFATLILGLKCATISTSSSIPLRFVFFVAGTTSSALTMGSTYSNVESDSTLFASAFVEEVIAFLGFNRVPGK